MKKTIFLLVLILIISASLMAVFFGCTPQCVDPTDPTTSSLAFSINSTSAKKLSIVCNDQSLDAITQIVKDAIYDNCGYAVPVVTDEEIKSVEKAIYIGDSAHIDVDSVDKALLPVADKEFSFIVLDDAFWLKANTSVGYYNGASMFARRLSQSSDKGIGILSKKHTGNDILTAMSFNLMAGVQAGDERVDHVVDTILKYKPSVIGVQEATDVWMDMLRQKLGDIYGIVGVGRNANCKDEHSAILYLAEDFDLITSGTKWLSKTPDVPGSKLPESHYTRIMTYALLSRKSDEKQFLHVNTHLDYGTTTTEEQTKVAQVQTMFDIINSLPNAPTIITGDFNATVGTPAYDKMVNANYIDSAEHIPSRLRMPTYHGLRGTTGAPRHIDYIFTTKDFSSAYYRICTEGVNGKDVSDHFPIFAVLNID